MTLEAKVHGLRLQVIRRAEQLGSVSRACREAGISRALFYRWRRRLERYGVGGRASAPTPGAPRAAGAAGARGRAAAAERGSQRGHLGGASDRGLSAHRWQLRVAPSTVQRALRHAGLATRRQRLTVLEHRALRTAGGVRHWP
jgi:transposase-like protein